MEVNYIVIQAGGLGTRLGKLTRNRPKALVPVLNRPIVFHLFERWPKCKFIIIGDYKYEVLSRYLQTFADVDYLLVKAEGKGNGAGVAEALKYIPAGEPFMLLWSDLLLDESLALPEESAPCYVGVSDRFPCSWRFRAGTMEKLPSEGKSGVAGCFLFDSKERLQGLPGEGSFTKWLTESKLLLQAWNLRETAEAGTLEAVKTIDPGTARCRPYNHMEFTKDCVIKTGLTEEGKKLIEREARWYKAVAAYGFQAVPKIYVYEPLTMERIEGENIFLAKLSEEQKKKVIDQLVEMLDGLHKSAQPGPDYFGLEKDYYSKTIKRVQGIRDAIPFADQPYININEKMCRNVLLFREEFWQEIHDFLFQADFGPIHGDCTLTNTMIDKDGRIYFIDARGYFGTREIMGDVYYDWAKIYYSLAGRFDRFNIKDFELEIAEDGVRYEIARSGWEDLTQYFLDKIPDCNVAKLKLIHAIVWISLASHCWEDYDSMCLAYYNGLALWQEWREEHA